MPPWTWGINMTMNQMGREELIRDFESQNVSSEQIFKKLKAFREPLKASPELQPYQTPVQSSHQIREMVASDLHQILPLAAQLGYPCTLKDLQSRFAVLGAPPQASVLLVAESATGAIVGFLQLCENTTLVTGPGPG